MIELTWTIVHQHIHLVDKVTDGPERKDPACCARGTRTLVGRLPTPSSLSSGRRQPLHGHQRPHRCILLTRFNNKNSIAFDVATHSR